MMQHKDITFTTNIRHPGANLNVNLAQRQKGEGQYRWIASLLCLDLVTPLPRGQPCRRAARCGR